MGLAGPPQLVLLNRKDCHLCEEMEAILDEVLPALGLAYGRLDVDSSPELAERFGDVVPVLMRDGQPVAKVRVTPRQLERIIRRRRS